MPAPQCGITTEPAVLFADHRMECKRPDQGDPRCLHGRGGCDDCHDATLHVAGAASCPHGAKITQCVGITIGPVVHIAGWHDVDVPVEDQRRIAFTATHPDASPRFVALNLHAGKVGLLGKGRNVNPPMVHFQAEPAKTLRAPFLHLVFGIGSADTGYRDERGEVLMDSSDIDACEYVMFHGIDAPPRGRRWGHAPIVTPIGSGLYETLTRSSRRTRHTPSYVCAIPTRSASL